MDKKIKSKPVPYFCIAAKNYYTKGQSYDASQNSKDVYLKECIVDGKIKYNCFGRCCKTVLLENDICDKHKNQQKDPKKTFYYFNKDIQNKVNDTNSNTKIIKIDQEVRDKHPYFTNMGDRGRNKNIDKSTVYDFGDKNINDPIFLVLKLTKNPNLKKELQLYANKLLQTHKIYINENNEQEIIENPKQSIINKDLEESIKNLNKKYKEEKALEKNNTTFSYSDINNLMNDVLREDLSEDENEVISETEDLSKDETEVISKDETEVISKDETEVISKDETEVISKDENEVISKDETEVISEDENEVISEDDNSDEEYEVEEIITKKGRNLLLVSEKMSVIDPEEGNIVIGFLERIDKKYSTILKDEEHYTVLSDNTLKHNDIEYYRDVLEDRIFELINDKYIFKGRLSRKKDTYIFHLD